MYVKAEGSDLWHTDNTRSKRTAHAGYVVMVVRLAIGFGNWRNLQKGMVWRPAHDPAREADKRIASTAPKAPSPGLQLPGWPVGALPVAKAPPGNIGPPPVTAWIGAEGRALREGMASVSAGSTGVVAAPLAAQPIAKMNAV